MANVMERVYENDIVNDAYYLINLFNKERIEITQIQVQKLMYLFEGYYMNVKNVNKLYDCVYEAWSLGPVATPLYKEFKKYGKSDIKLTDEQVEIADHISEDKKELLQEIFETFKNFSSTDLINFTHVEGSPWEEAWKYEEYSEIKKEKLRIWFSKYVSE